MRWRMGRSSGNVEDYRGQRLGGGLKLGGGAAVIGLLLAWFFGIDPRLIFGLMQNVETTQPEAPPGGVQQTGQPTDEQAVFASKILAFTEDTWKTVLEERGMEYIPPKLVLFNDVVRSGCGTADAGVGPFYCPMDQKVYLDLAFFKELAQKFQAPGEAADAYVIAHEVGHHVQNLEGTSERVHTMQERSSQEEANALSVRLELQADCYAGIWANRTDQSQHFLEPGDVESALGAASAVGDDTLQRRMTGHVQPDSFTHGTSQQRMHWFQQGFQSGDMDQCDTFNGS